MFVFSNTFGQKKSFFWEQRRCFIELDVNAWREERYKEKEIDETAGKGSDETLSTGEVKNRWNGWGDAMAKERKSMPSEFSVPEDIKLYMLELKEEATRYGSDGTSVFTTGVFYKQASDGSQFKIRVPFETTIATEGWNGWSVEKTSVGEQAVNAAIQDQTGQVADSTADAAVGTGTIGSTRESSEGTAEGKSTGNASGIGDTEEGAVTGAGDPPATPGARATEGSPTPQTSPAQNPAAPAVPETKAAALETPIALTSLSPELTNGDLELNLDGTSINEVIDAVVDLVGKEEFDRTETLRAKARRFYCE